MPTRWTAAPTSTCASAPHGPVIETQEELLRTLGGIKKADGEWQAARRAFAAEFGSYDDGGAARAAADLILGKKARA